METKTIEKQRRFARRPLTALEKLSVIGLLGSGILLCPLGIFSLPALLAGILLLLSAGFVWTGIRWAPAVGALVSGSNLVFLLVGNGYPVYHLTHPKDAQLQPAAAQFPIFVVIVILLAFLIVAFGASLSAIAQNYRQGERKAPRWLTPALSGLIGLVVGVILIAGIAQPPTSTASASSAEATVHLTASNFAPNSVIVQQGSKLRIVADTSILHILSNGVWKNNTPQAGQEPGAPKVDNVQISGGSLEIGPFTTSGTYHIFCTVHLNMVLTIFVP